jgi:ankyrin repeat protein
MITSPDWTLDMDAKDVTGNTLLSIACQNNNKRIARLCLRRGADLNTQNVRGC